jgi:hypothetical protein
MQRNNVKDDAVEGGEDGERPPSSQPIAPAVAGQAPPQPAGKSIAYFLRIADETREAVRSSTALSGNDEDCGFIFSALVKTHNNIIRTIRDIPPWEWSGEFLRCEPELFLFLDQNRKRHPECAAFNQAHILASALSLYHRENQTPKPLTEQERAICIAANRDLVDEYSDALLRTYREIFNFLFEQGRNATHTAVAEIIKTITHEHEQTRQMIKETNGLIQTCNRTPESMNRRINRHKTAATSKPSLPFFISQTNRGKSHQRYRACRNRRINGSAQNRRDCIV